MRNTYTQAAKFDAWSSDQDLTKYMNPKFTSRIAEMNNLLPCIWNDSCSFCEETKAMAIWRMGWGCGRKVCRAMHVQVEWETGLQRQSEFWYFPTGDGLSLQSEYNLRICWFKWKIEIGKPFLIFTFMTESIKIGFFSPLGCVTDWRTLWISVTHGFLQETREYTNVCLFNFLSLCPFIEFWYLLYYLASHCFTLLYFSPYFCPIEFPLWFLLCPLLCSSWWLECKTNTFRLNLLVSHIQLDPKLDKTCLFHP